jgi:hypothetical protein
MLPCITLLQVRDWYVESFKELRGFPLVKSAVDEGKFTDLLRHIYRCASHSTRRHTCLCQLPAAQQRTCCDPPAAHMLTCTAA